MRQKGQRSLAAFFILIFILSFFFIFIFSVNAHAKTAKAHVHPAVAKALENQEKIEVAIILKQESRSSVGIQRIQTLSSSAMAELEDKHFVKSTNSIYSQVSKKDLENLKENPFIEKIEYRPPIHVFLQDSAGIINASLAWPRNISNINITGTGQTVCIIDTGVNYSHPDLGGCFGAGCKVIAGYDFVNSDAEDPADDNGHGTHVAGIVAANGSITGIAPEAKIVALKACNSSGDCSWSAMENALDWCISNSSIYNISVISMSLGTTDLYETYCDNSEAGAYTTVASLINNAVEKNITVVVSSGNNGNFTAISSPACIQNATAVGATTKTDSILYNRNNITDVVAPGANINSTYTNAAGYAIMSGTSMSAPHVSGAVALMQQSRNLELNKSYTQPEIETILKANGKQINDSSGSGLNFSRINVFKSIDSFVFPAYSWISAPNSTNLSSSVLINISAADNVGISSYNITINSTPYVMSKSGNYYWYNYTASTLGNITYNATFIDITGNSNTTNSITLTIGESIPPQYFNISATVFYPNLFNITWTDNVNISTVWIDFNGTNYTTIYSANSIYFFNLTFSTGNYTLRWYANDSSNNINSTSIINATILQGNPTLNLTFKINSNIYSSNIVIENDTTVNISVSSPAEGSVTLYQNSSLINQGTGIISNTSSFPEGIYNITAFYAETQNYTSAFETLFITAETLSTLPRSHRISPENNEYTNNQAVLFRVNATDTSLGNATLYIWNSSFLFSTNATNITGMYNESTWQYDLLEGNYTWNALVYDNAGNGNWSGDNWTFVIDTTSPTISLSISDTSITTGETANISCSSYDLNFDSIQIYVDSSLKVNSSTNFTSYLYSPSSTGTKEVNCTVYDKAGNFNSTNSSISVSSNGGNGNGNGGDDGGDGIGTTAITPSTVMTIIFVSITPEIPAKITISSAVKAATGISAIEIKVKNTLSNVEVSIKNISEAEVPSALENVYRYISIIHKNIEDENISEVSFDFAVDKSWLFDNNLSKETVKLSRYSDADDSWQALETELISETDEAISYNAISEGLSIFAITAEKVELEEAEKKEAEKEEKEKEPLFKKGLVGIILIIIIALVIAVILINKFYPLKKQFRFS